MINNSVSIKQTGVCYTNRNYQNRRSDEISLYHKTLIKTYSKQQIYEAKHKIKHSPATEK